MVVARLMITWLDFGVFATTCFGALALGSGLQDIVQIDGISSKFGIFAGRRRLDAISVDARLGAQDFWLTLGGLIHNNLGGHGPEKNEQKAISFRRVCVADDVLIDLWVTTSSSYLPENPDLNGYHNGYGAINVAAGTQTNVTFTFKRSSTNRSAELGGLYLTIFEDAGPPASLIVDSLVSATGFSEIVLGDGEAPDGRRLAPTYRYGPGVTQAHVTLVASNQSRHLSERLTKNRRPLGTTFLFAAALPEARHVRTCPLAERCGLGDRVQCPGSGACCNGNQCCPGIHGKDPFPCPSAETGFNSCPEKVKVADCTGGEEPVPTAEASEGCAVASHCLAGSKVRCPGSRACCSGNQCCPTLPGGFSFPCPSAHLNFTACGQRSKVHDCTIPDKTPSTIPDRTPSSIHERFKVETNQPAASFRKKQNKEETKNTLEKDFGLGDDPMQITSANVGYNNLGGHGPDVQDPEELRYVNVCKSCAIPVDLKITVVGSYTPKLPYMNGWNKMYGQVNVAFGSRVDLSLHFVHHVTNEPLVLEQLYLTIFDNATSIDLSPQGRVFVHGFDAYYTGSGREVAVKRGRPAEEAFGRLLLERGHVVYRFDETSEFRVKLWADEVEPDWFGNVVGHNFLFECSGSGSKFIVSKSEAQTSNSITTTTPAVTVSTNPAGCNTWVQCNPRCSLPGHACAEVVADGERKGTAKLCNSTSGCGHDCSGCPECHSCCCLLLDSNTSIPRHTNLSGQRGVSNVVAATLAVENVDFMALVRNPSLYLEFMEAIEESFRWCIRPEGHGQVENVTLRPSKGAVFVNAELSLAASADSKVSLEKLQESSQLCRRLQKALGDVDGIERVTEGYIRVSMVRVSSATTTQAADNRGEYGEPELAASDGAEPEVAFAFSVHNVDYSLLAQDHSLMSEFRRVVHTTILEIAEKASGRISANDIALQLSPGSVTVRAHVTTPDREAASLLQLGLFAYLGEEVEKRTKEIDGFELVTTGQVSVGRLLFLSLGFIGADVPAGGHGGTQLNRSKADHVIFGSGGGRGGTQLNRNKSDVNVSQKYLPKNGIHDDSTQDRERSHNISHTGTNVTQSNATPLLGDSVGVCFLIECGCPPHFDQAWCDNEGSGKVPSVWCQEKQENCEASCGKWCLTDDSWQEKAMARANTRFQPGQIGERRPTSIISAELFFTLRNVELTALLAHPHLLAQLKARTRDAIALAAQNGVEPDNIALLLSEGSVAESVTVHAIVTPPQSVGPYAVSASLRVSKTFARVVEVMIEGISGFRVVSVGKVGVVDIEVPDVASNTGKRNHINGLKTNMDPGSKNERLDQPMGGEPRRRDESEGAEKRNDSNPDRKNNRGNQNHTNNASAQNTPLNHTVVAGGRSKPEGESTHARSHKDSHQNQGPKSHDEHFAGQVANISMGSRGKATQGQDALASEVDAKRPEQKRNDSATSDETTNTPLNHTVVAGGRSKPEGESTHARSHKDSHQNQGPKSHDKHFAGQVANISMGSRGKATQGQGALASEVDAKRPEQKRNDSATSDETTNETMPVAENTKADMENSESSGSMVLQLTMHNLSYTMLVHKPALLRQFEASLQEAIALEAGHGISPDDVAVVTSSGSVIVNAIISLPSGISVDSVLWSLQSSTSLSKSIIEWAHGVDGLDEIVTGHLSVSSIRLLRLVDTENRVEVPNESSTTMQAATTATTANVATTSTVTTSRTTTTATTTTTRRETTTEATTITTTSNRPRTATYSVSAKARFPADHVVASLGAGGDDPSGGVVILSLTLRNMDFAILSARPSLKTMLLDTARKVIAAAAGAPSGAGGVHVSLVPGSVCLHAALNFMNPSDASEALSHLRSALGWLERALVAKIQALPRIELVTVGVISAGRAMALQQREAVAVDFLDGHIQMGSGRHVDDSPEAAIFAEITAAPWYTSALRGVLFLCLICLGVPICAGMIRGCCERIERRGANDAVRAAEFGWKRPDAWYNPVMAADVNTAEGADANDFDRGPYTENGGSAGLSGPVHNWSSMHVTGGGMGTRRAYWMESQEPVSTPLLPPRSFDRASDPPQSPFNSRRTSPTNTAYVEYLSSMGNSAIAGAHPAASIHADMIASPELDRAIDRGRPAAAVHADMISNLRDGYRGTNGCPAASCRVDLLGGYASPGNSWDAGFAAMPCNTSGSYSEPVSQMPAQQQDSWSRRANLEAADVSSNVVDRMLNGASTAGYAGAESVGYTGAESVIMRNDQTNCVVQAMLGTDSGGFNIR